MLVSTYTYTLLTCIIIIFNLCLIVSGQTGIAGNKCIRQYDGRIGIYLPVWECKSVTDILKKRRIKFSKPRWSYKKIPGVVCCLESDVQRQEEEDEATYMQTTTPSMPGRRISEIKCEEYSKHVTLEVTRHFLGFHSSPKINKKPNCDYIKNPLIFGGEPTRRGEFPHMAAIGQTQKNGDIKWFCGGSLISEKFVLTAAHCFLSSVSDLNIVRLGDQNLNSTLDRANPIDLGIKGVHFHPQYKGYRYDDIALIELSTPAFLDKYIRPACLWTNDVINAESAIVTGWGTINSSGKRSDELMKIGIKIFENEQCAPMYEPFTISPRFSEGIIDTHICAGDLAGVKDACQGDSGGPLQIPSKENPCLFYVVGVTSLGIGCALEDTLGIYTRVSKYTDWIEKVVWDN